MKRQILNFLLLCCTSALFSFTGSANACVVNASQTLTVCANDTVWVGQIAHSTTGMFTDTLFGVAVGGCDSIVMTDLTVIAPVNGSQTLTVCANDTVWVGQIAHSATGMYTDTLFAAAASGCDSIVMTDLTVRALVTGSQSFTFCKGDSVMVGMNTYKMAGMYSDVFAGAAANGCDSTVMTTVIINDTTVSQTVYVCFGGSMMVGNIIHNATGMYVDTLNTVLGCDSIVNTNLTIYPAVDISVSKADSIRTLYANATNATYQWLNCNAGKAVIPNEINHVYVANANGSFCVVVTQNGCKDTSACFTINTVGINETGANNTISVYPNPANNMVVITADAPTVVSIVNMLGEVVKEEKIQTAAVIDITNLKSGFYFIRNTEGYATKLVKQ